MYADTDSEGKVNVMLISREELEQLIAELCIARMRLNRLQQYDGMYMMERLRVKLIRELQQTAGLKRCIKILK